MPTSRAMSARLERHSARLEMNIATFNLGRSAPGGTAIALLEVDQPIPDELLEKINALPHVARAERLFF